MRSWRVLVLSAVVTLVVIGLAVIVGVMGQRASGGPRESDYLAGSTDSCVTCHRRASPGIVDQYGRSAMAAAKVTCQDCHAVPADYPGAEQHEGATILASPTPARCQRCHEREVAQFNQSRHSVPAFVAYAGTAALTPPFRKLYDAIPEGQPTDKVRNALFAIEGKDITDFACVKCHEVGEPRLDGSVGKCQKCHLRHEFSISQARKPETCNNCHIGPDHPHWEIYHESPHGVMYETQGSQWNWKARPDTLTPVDMPAPTCATCHMSGFAGASTTHDVGDRLTWFLFSEVSERRPAWESNRARMQTVCFSCHNSKFITSYYAAADTATEQVNKWVRDSQALVAPLRDKGLLTKEPFDEPIEFEQFELWHHWGRTAKFGVWMQGPDYVQWHGAYEITKSMVELKDMVHQKLAAQPSEEKPKEAP